MSKAAHGFFTRTSWCPYSSAPASGCARTGPVPVPRCAPTRLLLVPRARATRSYSCARYLAFAPTRPLLVRVLAPTRPLLVRYSPATRPLLVAALRSYSFATRARHVPVPVGARACAVPLPLRTRSLPFYPPPWTRRAAEPRYTPGARNRGRRAPRARRARDFPARLARRARSAPGASCAPPPRRRAGGARSGARAERRTGRQKRKTKSGPPRRAISRLSCGGDPPRFPPVCPPRASSPLGARAAPSLLHGAATEEKTRDEDNDRPRGRRGEDHRGARCPC